MTQHMSDKNFHTDLAGSLGPAKFPASRTAAPSHACSSLSQEGEGYPSMCFCLGWAYAGITQKVRDEGQVQLNGSPVLRDPFLSILLSRSQPYKLCHIFITHARNGTASKMERKEGHPWPWMRQHDRTGMTELLSLTACVAAPPGMQ